MGLALSLTTADPVIIKKEIPPQKTEWDILIEALIQVESGGNPFAVGRSNDVGVLQITPIYVREVNRILKEDVYSLDQRTDIEKSIEMFEIYQGHHNPEKDILRAIHLHNPGAGSWYRDKVMAEMEKIKAESLTK
jgi:hypothetical protein